MIKCSTVDRKTDRSDRDPGGRLRAASCPAREGVVPTRRIGRPFPLSQTAVRTANDGIRVGGFVRQATRLGEGRWGSVQCLRRSSPLGSGCTAAEEPAMTNVRDLTDEEIIDALRRAAATWWREEDVVLLEELVRRFRRLRETHPTFRAK